LVRNLPRIRPSSEFSERLSARLLAESAIAANPGASLSRQARVASLAAAAVVLALGAARAFTSRQPDLYRMAPVVATAPLSTTSPFGTSALVATVPTGMSIWPAIMMASQAPAHYAASESVTER
jgi:hypothetical protein